MLDARAGAGHRAALAGTFGIEEAHITETPERCDPTDKWSATTCEDTLPVEIANNDEYTPEFIIPRGIGYYHKVGACGCCLCAASAAPVRRASQRRRDAAARVVVRVGVALTRSPSRSATGKSTTNRAATGPTRRAPLASGRRTTL